MNFLGKLKDFWLWFWFDKKYPRKLVKTKPPDMEKVLGKHLVRIFVKCPACDEKLKGHIIADLAVRIWR